MHVSFLRFSNQPICVFALFIMAAATAASAAQKQIFMDLAARFEFKVEIVEEILKAGVRSLSDFRYYPADNAELVQAFVVPCKFDDERLQGARLKSAWNSVVRAEKASEVPGADIQLDEEELLPSNQLNSLKELHYARYHLRFAPEVAPGDRLITKLSRALTKNSLEVYQIPQVKNLMAQRHDPPKRRKIAQNLWLTGEEEEPTQTDSAGYMERLWTYLIALSIAGIEKTLTPPATAESLSTNSAEYVMVPMDILLKYWQRAEKLRKSLPESNRIHVIEHLDRTERAEWAQRFANKGDTLGRIILQVYQERDAHWLAPPPMAAPSSTVRSASMASMAPPEPSRPAASGGKMAQALRDGKPLCKNWQNGRCPEQQARSCQDGEHLCAHLLKSGRVCGNPGHIGSKCNNKQRR